MDPSPPQRNEQSISESARAWPSGWAVSHVATTGSTNADLLIAAAAGAPDRTVLSTDHQTSGRGRLDRKWDAPPGTNLLVSFLFRSVPDRPELLMRRLSVAAVEATRRVSGVDARLKWPNDILVGDRKLAGVLAQRAPDGPVVIGMGLNVGWAPEGAARIGESVDRDTLLREILVQFDILESGVHERYVELLSTIGKHVRVIGTDRETTGRAIGVEPDGRLLVLDDCAVTHRFDAGDVVHLR